MFKVLFCNWVPHNKDVYSRNNQAKKHLKSQLSHLNDLRDETTVRYVRTAIFNKIWRKQKSADSLWRMMLISRSFKLEIYVTKAIQKVELWFLSYLICRGFWVPHPGPIKQGLWLWLRTPKAIKNKNSNVVAFWLGIPLMTTCHLKIPEIQRSLRKRTGKRT